MNAIPIGTAHSLELRRTFAAPRERVYRAWTDAQSLTRWFAPSDKYTVVVHALELRVGGAYRFEMRHSSGKSHMVSGTYRELSPPRRLVFTWRWEDGPEGPETLVTIELNSRGDATELHLRHERFATDAAVQEHTKGWNGCLDRMTAAL